MPSGTPQWGKAWKAAVAKWYQTAMNINSSGSVMANRNNYYDLDPTYRNAFGQPLMRMTFDYKENEHKLGRHAAQTVNDIAKSMNATAIIPATARVDPWTVVPYQSTHNTGGTIMGSSPRDSAVNKYLQSWDCHNLFTVGANVFVHNAAYNPTGPVGHSPIGRRRRSSAMPKIPARWCRHDGRLGNRVAARGRARARGRGRGRPGAGRPGAR